MQLTSKRISAINDLLRSEGFHPEEIMVGVTAVLVSRDAVEDPIALVRAVAREHRGKRQETAAASTTEKLYPCTECRATGWVPVTSGWTVGGVQISPEQVAQPAVAQCGVCHGVKYVLSQSVEEERITLQEFLARNPGFEWGATQPGPPDALMALPAASAPSASAEARAEERLLLP